MSAVHERTVAPAIAMAKIEARAILVRGRVRRSDIRECEMTVGWPANLHLIPESARGFARRAAGQFVMLFEDFGLRILRPQD